MDADDRARALVRHLLLRRRQPVLRARERARSRPGRARWASGAPPASSWAPRRTASCRRRRGEADVREPDRPAVDERRLRPARDRAGAPAVTPLQMTRFYALVANGGKLVNPHLVEDIEQPAGSREEAPVVLRSFEPARRRATSASPDWAIQLRAGGSLRGDPRASTGLRTAIFGGLRGLRRRQDRDGGEVRPAPAGIPRTGRLGSPAARPGVVLRLRPDRRHRGAHERAPPPGRLRHDRERRPRRRGRGARRRSRSSQSTGAWRRPIEYGEVYSD